MSEPVLRSSTPAGAEEARILQFTIATGKALLENGAEVVRVEQTMQHIASSYGLTSFEVFVITNGIFVSASGAQLSELRNVPSRGVHLGKVAAINELSRQISAGKLPIAQAELALQAAQNLPTLSCTTQVLASAFGAFSFCFLFGGTWLDALVSLVAGAALGAYLYWCNLRKVAGLFQRLTGAALASVCCIAISALCTALQIHTSAAIIGAFMILTPGVAFTISIRDLVRADYLSGTIRMIDAVLIATSIAIGAGLVLWAEQFLLGGLL